MKLPIIYDKWAFGILMVGDAHPTCYLLNVNHPAWIVIFDTRKKIFRGASISLFSLFDPDPDPDSP